LARLQAAVQEEQRGRRVDLSRGVRPEFVGRGAAIADDPCDRDPGWRLRSRKDDTTVQRRRSTVDRPSYNSPLAPTVVSGVRQQAAMSPRWCRSNARPRKSSPANAHRHSRSGDGPSKTTISSPVRPKLVDGLAGCADRGTLSSHEPDPS